MPYDPYREQRRQRDTDLAKDELAEIDKAKECMEESFDRLREIFTYHPKIGKQDTKQDLKYFEELVMEGFNDLLANLRDSIERDGDLELSGASVIKKSPNSCMEGFSAGRAIREIDGK